MSDKLTIEQRHRDAAADAVKAYRDQKNANWQQRIRDGECDDGEMVQAFARFEASLRTPTPEQAGEVERLRAAIKLTISDASFHLKKYRPHCLEALEAALQSTPPAQPTAEVFPSAPKNPAQPMADAVERIAKAMHEADPDVGCTWEEWLAYAEKHPDHLQSVEFTRRQARAVTALTTIAGDYVMVPREGCTCARRHDPDQFDHERTCAVVSAASPTGGE